ncbi:MAG: PIN domain-containing protein [Planctomycetes bacterium]|nr:PIN domain-containing protein [Planctomycetota bacterium]
MRILLDTNVLCRLAERGHPHHGVAESAVTKLRNEQHELCLVPQVLYEYWVVVTRPIAENGLGMPLPDAVEAIDFCLDQFTLLRDERGIFSLWRELVRQHEVKGKSAHDARLVAAMKRHGLEHLLTFNVADFQRYEGIELLDALAIATT